MPVVKLYGKPEYLPETTIGLSDKPENWSPAYRFTYLLITSLGRVISSALSKAGYEKSPGEILIRPRSEHGWAQNASDLHIEVYFPELSNTGIGSVQVIEYLRENLRALLVGTGLKPFIDIEIVGLVTMGITISADGKILNSWGPRDV